MNQHSEGVAAAVLDPQNPWLGLFSYTEDTRAYFHGRDEEAAELARRVQRKLLTVLFGQSGLGKTSLLRAGLLPRLRAEGYCPVYVRVDYSPESPSPSEQIKEAIFKASSSAGYWTQAGTAVPGESLWEFMHHRGDLLRDADGRTLVPLLIFDQFEEVFTLGQADDAGRLRARQFLEDLADLAENRPPAALEAKIEQDEEAAGNFDFARADYRILIALREDYLAHLEGLKSLMPSITQNRMRLARMNGAQALSAVVKPGGALVSQEVAESIVRFVGGGSGLANAEIEPSLLSLICRELNTVRLAQGRAEISADLLAGSRETILSEFYERTLADQPAGVRRVVEDELLTDSGYRENVAEERVLKALAAAGADADALATLVDRRLLRIEERLDMRRVELTHDVLCSVVVASRELRHEREARDEAQRQLALQQEREAATQRALVRARAIAGVCALLMVVAVIGAAFGWISLDRARKADAQAQQARGDAEKLVGFLIEDFYSELAPTGRLETLGKLAHMTVSYYDGLPAELVTPRTRALRAMALVREGAALDANGDLEGAYARFEEAQAVFEALRAEGDTSDTATYGLALALFSQGRGLISNGVRGTPEQLGQAVDLLRPLAYSAEGSREARLLYAEALNYFSHTQDKEAGVASAAEGRKLLAGMGALELSDLKATSGYADLADSQARHLLALGRTEEAKALSREVYSLTEKVLVRQPGDLHSLANRYLAANMLSEVASLQQDPAVAMDFADRAIQAAEDSVRFNPANLETWASWISGLDFMAYLQLARGEISRAIGSMEAGLALENDPRAPAGVGTMLAPMRAALANLQAQSGDTAAARRSIEAGRRNADAFIARLPAEDPRRQIFANAIDRWSNRVTLVSGDPATALASATADLESLDRIVVPEGQTSAGQALLGERRNSLTTAANAAIQLGRGAQAEKMARELLAHPPRQASELDLRIVTSRHRTQLAHALAMQGRNAEARTELAESLRFNRERQQAGESSIVFARDFAHALYVDALVSPAGSAERSRALAEAGGLIAGTSAEARQTSDMRLLSRWIAAAGTASGTAAAGSPATAGPARAD